MKSIFTTAAVVATTSAFAYPAAASPQYTEGHRYKPFYSRANTDIVKNSGICETTSGVNQYSGYFSVAEDVNLWFWFFEARQNADQAPLVAYFEGGPGDSSEYGLFTQHGPCHFVNDESEPSLNPYSFNNHVNMLYIDQPVGVGFSYGNKTINSTKAAAPFVWDALQMFFATLPEYEGREFGILTYSYGGHYGPEFSRYILAQNAAIKNGTAKGVPINLTALLATNSWFDSGLQEKADIEFAYNNTYRQLINESFYNELMHRYIEDVKPACDRCAATGTNDDCSDAWNKYSDEIDDPLNKSITARYPDFNQEDVRADSEEAPTTHEDYLARDEVKRAIGAKVDYVSQSTETRDAFYASGDDARSFLGELSEIVRDGVRVLIWTGDTDSVCDWPGTLAVADSVDWCHKDEFAGLSLEPYTVNGTEKGTFKAVENLIFMRVFEAGHDLAFYQPETALQVFEQIMSTGTVFST